MKIKTFHYTMYIQGFEIVIGCTTTSQAKFFKLTGLTRAARNYLSINQKHFQVTDTVFATAGLGGEVRSVFKELIGHWVPIADLKAAIEKYRELSQKFNISGPDVVKLAEIQTILWKN